MGTTSLTFFKLLTPLCQSLLQPLFVHLSVTLLMTLNCVWKPRCRDRAKVHGVTALQQLIRRIRSMKVPPEDNDKPSGGKVCGRYGETTHTSTAYDGTFGLLQCVRRASSVVVVLHIDSAVYREGSSVGCSHWSSSVFRWKGGPPLPHSVDWLSFRLGRSNATQALY